MSGITILSGDEALEATLAAEYGNSMPVRRAWSADWKDPAEATLDACSADPELLVIGADVPYPAAQQIVTTVDRNHPATTTVVMVRQVDIDGVVELMRLGARDVIMAGLETAELRAKLDPIVDLARDRHHRSADSAPAVGPRRVISVLSPKGGTGKTTVATNLAVGLARRLPKQVLLVDLDLQFGDCATALGVKPEHTLMQAMRASSQDLSTMKVFLTSHRSGLAMLAPPAELAEADSIEGDDVKRTISALAEDFPYVVIDTAAGIDASALTAMELSTDLLFVTTAGIPSILALQRQLEVMDKIGFTSQSRQLVLNRATAKVGLSPTDVEAALGMEANFRIPDSKLMPLAMNEGNPSIEKDGGGLSRRFEEIVAGYAPEPSSGGARSLLRALRREG